MRKPIIAITPKTGNTNQEEQKYCYVFPNFIHCVSAVSYTHLTLPTN